MDAWVSHVDIIRDMADTVKWSMRGYEGIVQRTLKQLWPGGGFKRIERLFVLNYL